MKLITAIAMLSLTACASTGIIPIGPDTYTISEKGPQVGFGPPVAARAEVYRQANAFCAKNHKVPETVKLDLVNSGFARSAVATLDFKCVESAPASANPPVTN